MILGGKGLGSSVVVMVGRGDHAASAGGGRRGWCQWSENGFGENFGRNER
jgi:hypothetical protein